jgi:mRNA-degrading endonuclease RelE of RelBE toxin-antitoxin system
MSMFQVIFNPMSAAEMSALPKELQLELLAEFQVLPPDLVGEGEERVAWGERFGKIQREGKTLYRYRCLDYRIYFETHPEGIVVHRVLHKNTLSDFLFRSELPMTEDEQVADAGAFWQMIEEGKESKVVS